MYAYSDEAFGCVAWGKVCFMKKLFLLIAILMLAAAGQAWGASVTCYVSSAGSNTSPYDTPAKAANLVQTAMTYAITQAPTGTGPGQGHIIYILEGTYTTQFEMASANDVGSSYIGVSNLTTLAPSVMGSQPVLTKPNAWLIEIGKDNVTFSNLAFTTGPTSNATLYIKAGALGFVGNNLRIYDSTYAALKIASGGGGTFNRCSFEGSGGANLALIQGTTTSTFNYCKFLNSATKYAGTAGNISTTGTAVIFNNCIVGGQNTYGINVSNGATTINNSVIYGGWVGNAASPIIRIAGTATINNSLLIEAFISRSSIDGTWTSSGNLITANPGFTRRQRSGFIVPAVDDAGGTTYAKMLAGVLSARGLKGTFYLDALTAATNLAAIADIGTTYPNVMELGYHTYSHTDLSISGNVWQATRSTNTLSINRAGAGTLSYTGGSACSVAAVCDNILASSLQQIRAQLVTDGWSVTDNLYSTSSVQEKVNYRSKGESLAAVTNDNAITLLIDATGTTGYYKSEIVDGKAYIESAGMLNQTLYSMAPPYGYTNAGVENAVIGAGFWSVRSGVAQADAEWMLDNVDLGQLSYMSASEVTGNKTITGAANNGSGLIRITTDAHYYETGDVVTISGVGGTTEANGTWTITKVAATTFDLQGSTFANNWTSGGTAVNDTATKRHIHGICELASQYGAILFILGHTTAEISEHDWGVILDAIAEYSEITVTSAYDAINTIKTGGDWTTSDDRVYARTWTDLGNYTLLSSSSAINAGVDVGLTTDYAGNEIWENVDIGAYEYQPLMTDTVTGRVFTWPAVPGAIAYQLQIDIYSDFRNPIVNIVTTENSYNQGGLSPRYKYYWRVRAKRR